MINTADTHQILHNDEPLIGLAAAGRKYDVHPGTVARWIMKGCRAISGEQIQLEGVRRGYKWVTSAQALVRFFDRLSTPSTSAAPATLPTPADRRRSAEAAARELESMGA